MPDETTPKDIYTPTEEELKEVGFVYERFEKMKQGRSPFEREWKKDQDQYEMITRNRASEDWKANLALPDTTAAILAALGEMVDQVPGVTYLPRQKSDQARADTWNAAWKYSWAKGQGNLELMDHMLQSGIFGTAIGKEIYRYEEVDRKEVAEWVKDSEGQDTPVPKKWVTQKQVVYDDVQFKSINLRNFYVDENATTMETSADCIEIDWIGDKETFESVFAGYQNLDKVSTGSQLNFDWYKTALTEGYEIIHYYNCKKDMYHICANGVLLTRAGNPNPYKHKQLPYVRSIFNPIPNCFYGMGIPRLIRSLQEEKQSIRNMRLDANKLAINNIVLVDDKVELDDDELVSVPNKIIKGPPGSVQFMQPPSSNPNAFREEEFLRDDIIIAHGIDPRLQSLGSGGRNTATEIAILKESSLKRIRLTLRNLEWSALYRLGCLRLSNFMQFYSIPKIKQIFDDTGNIVDGQPEYPTIQKQGAQGMEQIPIKETDFRGEYDVIVVPDSTLPPSEALESQQSVNLYDRLKGHPDVDQRELVTMLIRAHRKNPNDILTKPGQAPLGAGPGGGAAQQPGQQMSAAQLMMPQVTQSQQLPPPGPNMSV
jgi:hypothetical protein